MKTKDGDDVASDTRIGEGDANLKGLLRVLRETRWPGVLSIETGGRDFARDPGPFVDAAVPFVRTESGR